MIIKLNESKYNKEILNATLAYLNKNYGDNPDYRFSIARDESGTACIKLEDYAHNLGFRNIEPDYSTGRRHSWRFSSTLRRIIDALKSDVSQEIGFDCYGEPDDDNSDYERIAYVLIYPSFN